MDEELKDKETKYVKILNVRTDERKKRIIEWVTLYRRNLDIFVEHYLDIKLHDFQKDILHEIGIKDNIMVIGSRAIGKTFILALACVCVCILYPNSEIVIVSSKIDQAGLIVSEKIKKELMKMSPRLRASIATIKNNQEFEVQFHNGSSIVVVPALDSSRGRRATFIIFEEFRLIPKYIADSVIEPMSHPRTIPFMMLDKYKELVPPEQTKLTYISSAGMKHEWMWEAIKTQITEVCNGNDWAFFAFDYFLALEHGLKTKKDIDSAKKKNDEITFLMEYCNIMYGESANAYFTLEQIKANCNIKVPFYPLEKEDLVSGIINNSYKQKGNNEIRIISVDIATAGGSKNDNTCISCIQAIPSEYGYKRKKLYQVIYNGMNSVIQCVNIKRLFYDFQADYCILDLRNNGASIYGIMTQKNKDPETAIEYPAWKIVENNHWFVNNPATIEDLKKNTLDSDAVPVVFPISATAPLNSAIAIDLRKQFNNKNFSLLMDTAEATDILQSDEDFIRSANQPYIMAPFVSNDEFISETIQLESTWKEGMLKLEEPSGATKDRYTSASYGNFFISIIERDLLKDDVPWDNEKMKRLNSRNFKSNNRLKSIMR